MEHLKWSGVLYIRLTAGPYMVTENHMSLKIQEGGLCEKKGNVNPENKSVVFGY